MTPKQMEQKLKELETRLRMFEAVSDITPEFNNVVSAAAAKSSGKTAASETQLVNEAGSSSYSVAKPMDGFIKVGSFNVPYYNA